ncbi:MAG: ferrochelatase [Anaerolineae bacterium]
MTPPPPRQSQYDALLVVSFGGPEGPDEVMPFLENVLRGRPVPRERMLEVAEHYQHFGGVSPINDQNRALIGALEEELAGAGIHLPVYWGNRNWAPFLEDTLRQMRTDGVRRALAFMTSAYSSYSGCRQYREDIERARAAIGEGAPEVDKLRVFYNHPGFVGPNARLLGEALACIPAERRDATAIAFTAHSLPAAMAAGSVYQAQLADTCQLVADLAGIPAERWRLVYQSRSGGPGQPWLEPDILDHLRALAAAGMRDVVVAPVGFISDHMEVLYDLDTEALELASELGLNLVRAGTVGTDPVFITMIRELIEERLWGEADPPRRALGERGPSHDVCPVDCCRYELRRPAPSPESVARA